MAGKVKRSENEEELWYGLSFAIILCRPFCLRIIDDLWSTNLKATQVSEATGTLKGQELL